MDEKKNENSRAPALNQYHPAFCNAMELELYNDRSLLEFIQKVPLNTLPREIDFLVIRKKEEGEIRSELGRFFRKYNIWEFKGFGASLNVSVFHKTMSYAYDYLYLQNESIGMEEVTLSFLREGWPEDLLSWLDMRGFEKQDSPAWAARYRKEGFPELQIVNIAHPESPTLLHILSHKAEAGDIKKAVEYMGTIPEDERKKAWLVMGLSISINKDPRIAELKGGTDMGGYYEALIEPLENIIKQKDEELKQKDAQLEQKDAEILRLKKELAAAQDE